MDLAGRCRRRAAGDRALRRDRSFRLAARRNLRAAALGRRPHRTRAHGTQTGPMTDVGNLLRIEPQPWMVDSGTLAVLDALAAGGAQARFVGGSVRDALLGQLTP